MPITIRIHDSWRAAGALLAAGHWPETEQAARPYKPHRVAEQAIRQLRPFNAHPAALAVNKLVGEGAGLSALYAQASAGWGDLAGAVADFTARADLPALWSAAQADWAQAEADAQAVLARADLAGFLDQTLGVAHRVIYPNLLLPGLHFVTADLPEGGVLLAAPPPKAWGASPPWRYSERHDEALAAWCEALALAALTPLHPSRAVTLALALTVLFLRQAEGEAAGDQFMVMEKKTRNLKELPSQVMALENALQAGKPAESW